MDQDNPNTGGGFNTTNANDRGTTGSSFGSGSSNFGASGTGSSFGTTTSSEVCAHCGQSLHQNGGLEQFLGRIGISDDMIHNLKTQISSVDLDQYLDTAREYLKNAGTGAKGASDKATRFAKENPGKVAAGVAVLAVGAGLLINSLRDRDRDVEIEFQPDPDVRRRS